MNYQQVLSIPYVFNIINLLKQNDKESIKIIKMEETFYIQDYKKNLFLIHENMGENNFHNLRKLLNTFILFEEYKNPFDIYIKSKRVDGYGYNNDLLNKLQMQYAIDKNYFDNYGESKNTKCDEEQCNSLVEVKLNKELELTKEAIKRKDKEIEELKAKLKVQDETIKRAWNY